MEFKALLKSTYITSVGIWNTNATTHASHANNMFSYINDTNKTMLLNAEPNSQSDADRIDFLVSLSNTFINTIVKLTGR